MAGLWEGTAREKGSDEDKLAVAFIDQLGELQLMVGSREQPELVLYKNICCQASVETVASSLRYQRTDTESGTLKASIANGLLVGEFDYRGKHTFSLRPNAAYRRGLTLQTLGGVYTHTDTPFFGLPMTLSLSITATGELTGAHTNGCSYNGRVAVVDTAYSMVKFDVELTGCGGRFGSSSRWNGKYRGLGVLRSSNGGTQNELYHSLVGPTWLGAHSVMR